MTTLPRLYCTLAEVIDDLELSGVKSESKLMGFIRAASQVIDRRGRFIPVTETRRFDGTGTDKLTIDPLLAVTSIVDDGDTLDSSDYLLYPRNRWWENGPYTEVRYDPDNGSVWTCERDAVAIAGRWGLYEATRSTGATLGANITDSAVSMAVGNGGLVSPGMIALIESEQVLIEATGAPTDSTANVAEDVDVSEENIDVNDGSQINVGETIRIDTEQMKVLDKANNTLLVDRGWNGTPKATHSNAADVYVYRTFSVTRGINGTTAAAHSSGVTIVQYMAPFDINYLCRQIAGLMFKKAQGKWAGKVGNAESGEVFYVQEFPNDPLKKIMAGYRFVGV